MGEENVQWITSERFTGSYLRQLSLGEGIDSDHIAATYENGVLTVTIPVERAKPRRIDVSREAAGGQRVIEHAATATSPPSTTT